jgi:hypothetical protein
MARKNPMVRVGRPPKLGGAPTGIKGPAVNASPMGGFNAAVPGAAFRTGGSVGYKRLPAHHDDPRLCKKR